MDLSVFFYVGIVLSIILALGLYITNLVFSFKYITYKLDKEAVINYIENTLKSRLIYKFNPRTVCLDNEEELVLGTWNGTISKCNCKGKKKDYECTAEDYDCKTEEGEKPINYTVFNGQRICVVREGDTFYDLIKSGKIIEKDKNCPDTDKSCGIVDTFDRKLYVKIG